MHHEIGVALTLKRNPSRYRTIYFAALAAVILLLSLPVLSMFMQTGLQGEGFSELYISKQGSLATKNIIDVHVGVPQSISVGVTNHLGHVSYYVLYVKLRNQTQALPDPFGPNPSPLLPIFESRVFLGDGMTSEIPLTFVFNNVAFSNGTSSVGGITINDDFLPVEALSKWDSEREGYYYQLFVELWLCNAAHFSYHGRFVGVWLKLAD